MSKTRARLGTWWEPVRYALQIAAMGLTGLIIGLVIVDVFALDGWSATVVEALTVYAVLGGLELVIVGRPLQRAIATSAQKSAVREARLRTEAARQEFESRLARGLDMAQHEAGALDIINRALEMATPEQHVELLLADSSRAHLVRSAGTGADRACRAESPRDCVAVRRGQTLEFADSEELDACPYLRGRGAPCSAVCVPVNVLGNTVGVLHAVGSVRASFTQDVTVRLETISTQAGARIGMMRALQRSEIQASTDPLTGLLNRRSVEDRIHALMGDGRPFSLVMCDLDNFKVLNDTHGHEAGDRALRQFASTLKTSLRPGDFAARYGGEEFLLVFPDAAADGALRAVERLREELALATSHGGTPPFTASFGVSDLRHGSTLDELLKHADDALLRAKREGKNRVLVADES